MDNNLDMDTWTGSQGHNSISENPGHSNSKKHTTILQFYYSTFKIQPIFMSKAFC